MKIATYASVADDPARLAEMEQEEKSARFFGITVTELRQQRRDLGQLLTGPYAGCSPGFAVMTENSIELEKFFKEMGARTA